MKLKDLLQKKKLINEVKLSTKEKTVAKLFWEKGVKTKYGKDVIDEYGQDVVNEATKMASKMNQLKTKIKEFQKYIKTSPEGKVALQILDYQEGYGENGESDVMDLFDKDIDSIY